MFGNWAFVVMSPNPAMGDWPAHQSVAQLEDGLGDRNCSNTELDLFLTMKVCKTCLNKKGAKESVYSPIDFEPNLHVRTFLTSNEWTPASSVTYRCRRTAELEESGKEKWFFHSSGIRKSNDGWTSVNQWKLWYHYCNIAYNRYQIDHW